MKRESKADRGGALLEIHTLPFCSNTFLRQREPWTLQQSLELQQSLSQLRPGLLPEIRMPCGTNCAHGYCCSLLSQLEMPSLQPRLALESLRLHSFTSQIQGSEGQTTVCHSKWLANLLDKSVDKMENFPRRSKNNNQEGMRKVV